MRSWPSIAGRARRLADSSRRVARSAFGRKTPRISLAKVDVRRVDLTPGEIEAGHRSWLRLDPKSHRLELILWFGTPPSYAVKLPPDLSRELVAWNDTAIDSLIPLLTEDVGKTSTNKEH